MFDPQQASDDYLVAFVNTAEHTGSPYSRSKRLAGTRPYCSTLLQDWKNFVEVAVSGYAWTYYEYDNEIGIRDLLQVLIDSEDLSVFPDHAKFISAIEAEDDKLRSVLVREVSLKQGAWWKDSIPSIGGKEYVETVPVQFEPYVKEA